MNGFEQREAAWIALNRIHKRIFTQAERALAAAGLPRLSWYDVLWELERSPEGLRALQLEQQLLFDQSSFSRRVGRMVEEGLITREVARGDGRGRLLKITAAGRETRAKMWEIYRRHIDTGMAEARQDGMLLPLGDLLG